jgi:enoyl-CoA hydratase
MGLITRVCDDRAGLYEEGKRIASQIVSCPPLAVQGAKEVIVYSRDHGVYAGLHYVAQKNAAAPISEDVMEAMSAFMEKRTPVFKGK